MVYKYYKLNKDFYTNTRRTIGRKEVQENEVEWEYWRITNAIVMFVLLILLEILAIVFNAQWLLGIWIAICILLILIRIGVVEHKYTKYINKLSTNEEQSTLKEVFDDETISIKKELEAYNKIEIGKLTLEDIKVIDGLKKDLTW